MKQTINYYVVTSYTYNVVVKYLILTTLHKVSVQ